MFGSRDAAKMIQMLKKHLADFGTTHIQASIVSIVSDGASVMKKLGKLSQVYDQLCYAHGIHLAVCVVLYKFGNVDNDEGEQENEVIFDDGHTAAIPAREECPVFTPEIVDVLKKVRKVVKRLSKKHSEK